MSRVRLSAGPYQESQVPRHGRAAHSETRPAAETISGSIDSRFGDLSQVPPHAQPNELLECAQAGVAGHGNSLPHADVIQRAFGPVYDLKQVRSYVGGDAPDAARRLGAKAYTTGDRVAFRAEPNLRLAAHEAAHVVQQRQGLRIPNAIGTRGDRYERTADDAADLVVQGRSAAHLLGPASGPGAESTKGLQLTPDFDQFGQAAQDTSRNLICDLTSPIVAGSTPYYRLSQHGPEIGPAHPDHSYLWMVRNRTTRAVIYSDVTRTPETRIAASIVGQYTVEVVMLNRGAATGIRLSLDQDVVGEAASLTAGLQGADANHARTMRELVNDFRQYIIDGAAATGPNGITARVLAAVLYVEVLNRPKAGREEELRDVDSLLSALERNEWVALPGTRMNRTLGVGQIRPATAAMVTGATPLVDQDRQNRDAARDQIQANYEALPLETKRAIFTQLQWPKSNIRMAAQLLATLKNRAHRYPTLTRAQFTADETAVGVVGTEYNSGGTTTAAADAGASEYGQWVWDNMHDPLIQEFFPDM